MTTSTPFTGLFWQSVPKVAAKKSEAPVRSWESSTYLPYLADAKAFSVSMFTTEELIAAANHKEVLLFDIECYMNYFLVAFTSFTSGKVVYLETTTAFTEPEIYKCRWIVEHFKLISFNGNSFDLPLLALALAGKSCNELKHATNQIIQQQVKPWIVLRSAKVPKLEVDHVDLIEVAPLQGSLKIYGGRLHVPKLQELPFHPDLVLTEDQITCVRWYCINSDLTATAFLYAELLPQIALRESMSTKYGIDLRSKSDAQIAEAVITTEFRRLTGYDAPRTEIEPGTAYRYHVPAYVQFSTPLLQNVLDTVRNAAFVINETGSPVLPKEIAALKINIGTSTYRMGIGGLHSCEEKQAVYADEDHVLVDRDVASYYPQIILNQRLYPKHLGEGFLDVYRNLVTQRLAAKKRAGDIKEELRELKKKLAELS